MADIYKITENITPNEGTNTPAHNNTPKFVNRQDLAEPCSQLTKDCGHEQTLDFLNAFDVWFSAAFQGSNDLERKKSELWFKCTRNLKTELMTDYAYETNTNEELKQTILARIKLKYPTKNRILKFLSSTTQQADQSLNEYF